MGDVKDEISTHINKAVSRVKERKNGPGIKTEIKRDPFGAECPIEDCGGILTQYASVAIYKPWRFHCTACDKTFENH